ncbi:MAG: hypothetical protein ACLQUT_05380 [Thermoleophilia bacterium]
MSAATDQLALRVSDPLQDAIDWRRQNPLAYDQIVEWARTDADYTGRCSIDLYGHLLRRPHFSRLLGLASPGPYLIDNTLLAQLSRLIVREYGLPFELRRSRSDEATP